MSPILPLPVVVDVLRNVVPDWEWLIGQIESDNGRLRFPPFLSQAIINLKIEVYPKLYECEQGPLVCALMAFMEPGEIREWNAAVEQMSLEERGLLVEEVVADLDRIEWPMIPKSPDEISRANALWLSLSAEEQKEAARINQYFYSGFLSLFYDTLAMMVHGEKLTSLVAQARDGNDQAFVKAVQIDYRILNAIPYFRQRYERAQMEGDHHFLTAVGRRLAAPPYRGKIRHKSLWLTFALLDQVGVLGTLSDPKILDICDECGVGGFRNRIEDVKNLSKRRRDYQEFQRRNGCVSTP